MKCPKCGSHKTSSFFKAKHEELVAFKECSDCGFEVEQTGN